MAKLCVTTECVCDLPEKLLNRLNMDIIYFHIYTDSGCFTDTDEVDARNILEYMERGGKKSKSEAPSANEYKAFFQKKLEDYDEIIHIAISSGISNSVKSASLATAKIGLNGRKVHVFDSGHLSSGMGFLAIKAAQMNQEGLSVREILEELEHMKQRVSTSFIVKNAEQIDKRLLFITHANCAMKDMQQIKAVAESSNCGPDAFGVLFVRNVKARNTK